MVTPTAPTRYYLAYGAALHPRNLRSRLGQIAPLSSTPVQIPSAYLSFDFRALPFVEPCFTSAIVEGVNDFVERGAAGTGSGSGLMLDEEAKAKWIWERCAPGLEWRTGARVPYLEGVAYELSEEHWAQVMHTTTSSTSPTSAYEVLQVTAVKFGQGDPTKPLGVIEVSMPIARREFREKGLQPTIRVLRDTILGAHLNTLSQPYLAHLTILRPYTSTSTLAKSLATYSVTLLLVGPFLLSRILGSRFLGLRSAGEWVERVGWSTVRGLERAFRGVVGSGYRNEGKKKLAPVKGRKGE